MNGMGRRFAGKKDKDGGSSHKRDKSKEFKTVEKSTEKKTRSRSDIFNWMFRDSNKKTNKSEKEEDEEIEKVESLRRLLQKEGQNDVNDEQIIFCLNSKFANGDAEKAHRFLVVIQESLSGVVYPYDPFTKMLGAENPSVTCWLDSFLSSLFSVPTQFQDLLNNFYEDPSKQKLIQLIRLWTERILDSLQECGWKDLNRASQQDPTEAHMKIGDILDWPMLNLRIDFQHGGIENEQDDHKTSQERTVPISILTNHPGPGPVTLEKCIEESLNSYVQISRRVEPFLPGTTLSHDEKPYQEHIESIEAESATPPTSPMEITGQTHSQNQLVREVTHEQRSLYRSMSRASTLWPSKPAPANNQELAQHIQKHKPMIGFDLKRYGVGSDGRTQRINTPVDIPEEMSLPHFVDEDGIQTNVPFSDRFKLVLRSMICHRGESLNSGHYTSVVRLRVETDGDWDSTRPNDSQHPPDYAEDRWMVHDDIADERVKCADINAALKDDKYGMPVTLWYELVPTYEGFLYEELQENFMDNATPPSYTISSVPSIDVQACQTSPESKQGQGNDEGYFTSPSNENNTSTVRFSSETDRARASLQLPDDDRRASVAATDASSISVDKSDYDSAPATPGEEPASTRMSRTFRRSKTSRSRPPSVSNENRNAFGYIKNLVSRTSKESLQRPDLTKESIPPVPAIPGLDGFAESPSSGEFAKPVETNGTLSRKGSKKGKKRSQSKANLEIDAKDKESNETDRVCIIM
ncbi:hypothetical protein DSL72_008979 [Monilinia vaccinii-corymbosi]|uniref:ubiquitinyl hydrolase 1 n=1 Tax=Monilinia vaccinii-corymbosi TaxID=61207 RepID=A0A8A3PSN6_9HELO|nr:hypothetical protein DSL72_008979 [Monilinia vaccinii-corymbosi]